jgi:hypothetical protein
MIERIGRGGGDLNARPPAPRQGIRKADQFAASCIQNIVAERKSWTFEFMPHGEISEDCLYLNIWTPARSAGEKRPVFLWMYGGGNVAGSAAVPLYDGESLAKKGLVVVTINYRLGLFGFFTHPELTKESDTSVNYGILDQLAALQWVHEISRPSAAIRHGLRSPDSQPAPATLTFWLHRRLQSVFSLGPLKKADRILCPTCARSSSRSKTAFTLPRQRVCILWRS